MLIRQWACLPAVRAETQVLGSTTARTNRRRRGDVAVSDAAPFEASVCMHTRTDHSDPLSSRTEASFLRSKADTPMKGNAT